MARFSEQFVQQVQQATDIIELVGQYVALKRRGKEFLGLCPFHDDRKPSMNVSPAKQIFKCFACGAGGDVFKFLMLYEKYSFPEAVQALAERAHIPIPTDQAPQAQTTQQGLSKNDLIKVTSFAAEFFHRQLRTPEGKNALDYAYKRGFNDEAIDRFCLGYSPDSWETLLRAAQARGFSEEQIVEAGLAIRRENNSGCYDRFRNRLMFPILDVAANVIAFGGRALASEERAKYLNSPETILFDKSSQLFGLNWARQEIVSSGTAVVVEGYLDVLMPMQAGVGNLVATLGTALTDRHVRLLSRYAKEAVLIFDADQAGAMAAERALEIFLAQQLHVRVATIPEGKDPCDYCLAEGPDAIKSLIEKAPDALQYVWDQRFQQYRQAGENLADRKRVVEEFLRLVASSQAYGAIDELRQGQLAQHIGHMLNIPSAQLQEEMKRLSRRMRQHVQPQTQTQSSSESISRNPQRIILEVLLNEPDLFSTVFEKLSPEDFKNPQARAIAQRIWELGEEGKLTLENVQGSPDMAPYSSLITDLVLAGDRRGEHAQALARAVENVLYHRERQDLHQVKAGNLDDEALLRLAQQLKTPDVRRMPKIH